MSVTRCFSERRFPFELTGVDEDADVADAADVDVPDRQDEATVVVLNATVDTDIVIDAAADASGNEWNKAKAAQTVVELETRVDTYDVMEVPGLDAPYIEAETTVMVELEGYSAAAERMVPQ